MPLCADAGSIDGLNVHGAIIDELHAHKTRQWSTSLRRPRRQRQPLLFEITTAGFDRHSSASSTTTTVKVLEGALQDDSFFAFIASADEDDDWTDPRSGARPTSLGISVKEDDLDRKAERAMPCRGPRTPSAAAPEPLDGQDARWIALAVWDVRGAVAGALGWEDLLCRTRLSATTDVTALDLGLPATMTMVLATRFRASSCRRTISQACGHDRVPYDLKPGTASSTPPGDVVDYGAIEQRILADAALFQVREIAYDPWNATHIALRLQDEGATMIEFRQGFRSMAAPTRELEKLIVSRRLAHGGNPVTRWMAANVAVAQDPAGNLKPAKDKSTERIDGIVAPHHGDRPRPRRPGRAPARVLHVLCLKGKRCNHARAYEALTARGSHGGDPAQPGHDTVLQLPRASPLRPARRGFARSRWRIGRREPASFQDVIVMYSARSAMPGAY